jgi:hypothetical protein
VAAFRKGLTVGAEVIGAVADLDRERGALSATFQIEARTIGRATELGIASFYEGLAAAGYDVDKPGWQLLVQAEPANPD